MSRGRTAKVLTHRDDGAAVSRHPDQLIDAPEGLAAAAYGADPAGGARSSAEARP